MEISVIVHYYLHRDNNISEFYENHENCTGIKGTWMRKKYKLFALWLMNKTIMIAFWKVELVMT